MFRHYISLGCFCGTASAMSKYGLRSFSGPFDWCVSSLSGILHFMENNFTDFLCREGSVKSTSMFFITNLIFSRITPLFQKKKQ